MFHQRKRIIFARYSSVFKSFFLQIAENRRALFDIARRADSTPCILLRDCPMLGVVAKIISRQDTEVFDGGSFKRSFNLDCKLHVVGVCTTL